MDLFMTAEERREVLRQYGKDWQLSTFIETGTNDGGTPWALKDSFTQLFTIELGKAQWLAATVKFRKFPQVTCLHGDSADVLPEVLGKIDEPALVWLDGHYSGPGTAHGKTSTPVVEELLALFRDGRPHVILVDDARIFDGGPEHRLYEHYATYPSLSWVEETAAEANYNYELLDDIIRLTP